MLKNAYMSVQKEKSHCCCFRESFVVQAFREKRVKKEKKNPEEKKKTGTGRWERRILCV